MNKFNHNKIKLIKRLTNYQLAVSLVYVAVNSRCMLLIWSMLSCVQSSRQTSSDSESKASMSPPAVGFLMSHQILSSSDGHLSTCISTSQVSSGPHTYRDRFAVSIKTPQPHTFCFVVWGRCLLELETVKPSDIT